MVDAKANSYVEASLNNTIPGSWLALVAGTKAYRFESCPDYRTKCNNRSVGKVTSMVAKPIRYGSNRVKK